MSQAEKWYQRFLSYEWLLFLIVAFLNALPVIQSPYFPSLDGPTHIYNAKLIHELLSGNSQFLQQYYDFNNWIVPNWGGHLAMTALIFVFPSTLAARIFIILCVFLLPISFRYCVRKINPTSHFAPYLIFPFTYTFMLCMGFYNFYLGTIILFATVGALFKFYHAPFKTSRFIVVFLLIILCYLSHLFIFISLGMITLCYCAIDAIKRYYKKEFLLAIIKTPLRLLLAFIIPVFLTLNYFMRFHGSSEKIYLFKSELLEWILICRSMICYIKQDEIMYTTYAFLVFILLFSIAVFLRSKQVKDDMAGKPISLSSFFSALRLQDTFLLMLFAFIVLYFRLPDSDSFAGFVSVRFNLMIFLFLILWVSAFNYPKWIAVLSLSVLFFAQYNLLALHSKDFKKLNPEIEEILIIEKEIKSNTVILPLNFSDFQWLSGHNSNYLGINKPVVILENYECSSLYFPLRWNTNNEVKKLHGTEWLKFERVDSKILNKINYIFVQGKNSMPDSLKTEILKSFRLQKETERCFLFEKKYPKF